MIYNINGFTLSESFNSATRNEQKIDLTHQEQEALRLFFTSDNGFVDTQTLESTIWGGSVVTSNSLRKLISGLRLKFDDKKSFQNIRSKGYQLSFQSTKIKQSDNKLTKTIKALIVVITLVSFFSALLLVNQYIVDKKSNLPQIISTQTVFESNDYILDYAAYDNALYVTTRNSKTSTLYKVLNRQNIKLMSANFPGAYRGIEIHTSGLTVMHVIEKSKCKIKIYKRPVEELIDEIPCNRQNAFPSFDWIDETSFYITFNVNPNSSIKPFIYNLKTKRLEEVINTNFESKNDDKFIDAFIKAKGDGVFSLRTNHLDQMSLIYFEGDERKTIYDYRAQPYSIAVSKKNLFFIGNNNELFNVSLSDDILSQEFNVSLFLAPQATKIDDPLVLQDELYFSLGNASKEIIHSMSGNFTYSLENAVRDFTYTDKVLSVLALTNSGYVVEQLKQGVIFNTVYFDSQLNFRYLAFYQGDIYLAGASGVYKLIDKKPKLISELKVVRLVTNGQCMIAEAKNGIFQFGANNSSFKKIAEQGERAFSSEHGCLFVDKLSGNIVNEKREPIAKQTMNRLLFEHQGKITHWHQVKDKTHFVDVETGKVIAQTKSRILFKKVISYEGDILYLDQADVKTSIIKVKQF